MTRKSKAELQAEQEAEMAALVVDPAPEEHNYVPTAVEVQAPVEDYPERPYTQAMTAEQSEHLRAAGMHPDS